MLALVASTQGLLLAQGAWLSNREWIAETLCVNPGTDCDGTCQLKDRMEAMAHGPHASHDAGHGHDEAPTPLLELALSVRAHVAARVAALAPQESAVRGFGAGPIFDTGREASRGVFHPPRAATSA